MKLRPLALPPRQVLQRACNDASWRVRHAMASSSVDLVDACKKEGFGPELEQAVLRRFAFHLVDAEVGARVARVLRRLSAARARTDAARGG